MWNPVSGGVHTTRDVIWLHRMFYAKEKGQNIIIDLDILAVQAEELDTDGHEVWEGTDDEADDDTAMVSARYRWP